MTTRLNALISTWASTVSRMLTSPDEIPALKHATREIGEKASLVYLGPVSNLPQTTFSLDDFEGELITGFTTEDQRAYLEATTAVLLSHDDGPAVGASNLREALDAIEEDIRNPNDDETEEEDDDAW